MDRVEFVLRPAADAFIEVGVLVAVMLAVFGLVQVATKGRIEDALTRHRRLGPLAGALLGVVPGCGGAIVLMPLYRRGTVSFGTVVAALVATMGDSSFVLIAAAPGTALVVHLLLLVVGVLVGGVVDAVGFSPPRRSIGSPEPTGARSTVGAAAAVTGITGRGVLVRGPSSTLVAFWGLVLVGALIAAPVLTQVAGPADLARTFGGVDVHLIVGAAGALVMVGLTVVGRRNPYAPAAPTSIRVTMRDAARETAQVTTWVTIAFVAFEVITLVPHLDPGLLPAAGLTGVVAGAFVGLVPSCGPQIVLTGLYAQGGLPFAVLIANALSQDGDALLPLLAIDRRAAVIAAVITTVPGLLVGWVALGFVT